MAAAAEANAVMRELAVAAIQAGELGLDTEFMGEGRYRTLLCLVQVVVADPGAVDGLRIEVIDPLEPGLDPSPLAAVLADPAIEVVMHAGRQDVALLRRVWATEVRSLFDTQIAAGFAGVRAQAGYELLLSELLGIRLPKTASYTRWDARPLSPEQLSYAREDVLHLLAMAAELRTRLSARGRLEWAREESRALEQASDERDIDSLFARLPRIGGLDPRVRATALELVIWREATAAGEDRAVPSVLNDAALVEVARRRPSSMRDLEQIRGITPAVLRRRGGALLAAVERGAKRAPLPSESPRRAPPHEGDAALIALCEALVRSRALDSGIAYELVAARADLQEVVRAARAGRPEPDVRTLAGWRRELVGAELLDLLRGRRRLAVDERMALRVEG